LHAHIARLEAALMSSEELHSASNEDWQKLLLLIAHWQITAEKAENTAQDLNQPLSAIVNYAAAASQLLKGSVDSGDEELQRVLGKLADQVMRAGDLLRTMRTAIKQTSVRHAVCDLGQVVSESLALFSHMLKRADVQLQYQAIPNRAWVSIDSDQIRLVLKHLVQNAVESMAESNVENRVLSVRLDQSGPDEIEVSISNSGAAIEADQAAKLFIPFYSTRSNRLGMGLAISRAIVESHGGKIWLAAKRVDGAEFCFTVPCARNETTSRP
jgi:two-component system sensor kinase FixL